MNSTVYMLRCADGSYYVGKTDRPLVDRVGDHQAGLGGAYTKRRRPVKLVWSQDFHRYADAVAAERQIKGWRRDKKEALIAGRWEKLPVLSKRYTLRDAPLRAAPQGEADRSDATQSLHPEEGAQAPVSKDSHAEPHFNLTTYLPYLINRTGVQVASAFSDEIAHHGVTLQMWRVLAALHHEDGLRISDLAQLTSIDISTLSRLIGKMERHHLVERQRGHGADGRVVKVALTRKGNETAQKIVPVAQRYETDALAGFSAEEAATLKRMLNRVFSNLERSRELDQSA